MKKHILFLSTFIGFYAFAQVNVTATEGTAAATYTTIKGAFDAINAGTHQGVINISLTESTTETASAVLNAVSTYTSLVIKPASGVSAKISGALSSTPLLKILGSNVTIDGSNSDDSTTRDLTIENTSTSSPYVLWMGAPSDSVAQKNVVYKNINFINGNYLSSTAIIIGNGSGSTAGFFNDIIFRNNTIQKANAGIAVFANATVSGNGSGLLIESNDLSASGANAINTKGIEITGVDGGTVKNNIIGNFVDNGTVAKYGINILAGTINSTISGNTIFSLKNTLGTANTYYSIYGIQISGGVTRNANSGNTVSGNTIKELNGRGVSNVAAIYVWGNSTFPTNGVTISNNKISEIKNSYTPLSSATSKNVGSASGIFISAASNGSNAINIYNNFINDISVNAGNDVMANSSSIYNASGIAVLNGTGHRLYHNTINNLHIDGLAYNVSATATATAGVLTGPAVTASGAVDLRNNILSNTNTASLGNGYAIYSLAPNTIFSNIDYNDYYTESSNIAYLTSAQATFSDLVSAFGGNTNSKNIKPLFVSETDLHLTSANTTLDNLATYLSDVPTDIDGEVRSTITPDIGADEFTLETLTVNNAANKAKILIYPNPVHDVLTVASDKSVNQISVYNVTGQLIKEINNSNVIDLNNLSSGVYFVKTLVEGKTEMTKVIKK